jgi:hypothetical protein
VKLFTCELGFKKTNGVLFKFLNQKLHSAKAFHIPSSGLSAKKNKIPCVHSRFLKTFLVTVTRP